MPKSEVVVDVAACVPVLLLKLGLQFLRYESRRKKAVRIFKKELRAQLRALNIQKEYVNLFSKDYESAGSVRNLIAKMGGGASLLSLARAD
jgi:hypothetical protein